ncbi:MAG: leucyl aminopeptidase family protein [Pseudomonadota bacterium]
MTDRPVDGWIHRGDLDGAAVVPLWALVGDRFDAVSETWPAAARAWLAATKFVAKPGRSALLPAAEGGLFGALHIVADPTSPFDAAGAVAALPGVVYERADQSDVAPDVLALGFALASYRFRTSDDQGPGPRLVVDPTEARIARSARLAAAMRLGRDLVNEPANRLGPAELQAAVEAVAGSFGAEITTTVGDELLDAPFPAVHAVGRASPRAPRLIDLRWGDPAHPKVTLVGKGVCFDTGGLDIKPSSAMLLMKKDMGGAAVMLALAQALMAAALPLRLRLLVPAVENAVAGNAFRPGDVIATRKGLEVEIGNTDAEGRLVLADALTLADEEEPDLLLDAATLTGAARVALGAEIPALFTPDDELAAALAEAAAEAHDPLWRLPLHQPYRRLLDTKTADLNNVGSGGLAGAITAALFLRCFVGEARRWAHLDVYAHNPNDRPGRPKGGEATAMLALYRMLERRYGG